MQLELPYTRQHSITDVYAFLIQRQRQRNQLHETLDQAADEALEVALDARQAAEAGDKEQAEQLRGEFDDLWNVIEGALDDSSNGNDALLEGGPNDQEE